MGLGWRQQPNAALCHRGLWTEMPTREQGGPGGSVGTGQQGLGKGQAAGWHNPWHQTYVPSCAPRQGGADAGVIGVPASQPPAKGLGGSRGTLGTSRGPPALMPANSASSMPCRNGSSVALCCPVTLLTPGGTRSRHRATLPCSTTGTAPRPCLLLKNLQTPEKKSFSSAPAWVQLLPKTVLEPCMLPRSPLTPMGDMPTWAAGTRTP